MKIKILTAIAVSLSFCGYAQTKGTHALSLGVNMTTGKSESTTSSQSDVTNSKMRSFTLGYGVFIKDNSKIGLELNYGTYTNSYNNSLNETETKNYGGNLSYQQYYPLVKTLYAYAGGNAGYGYAKQHSNFDSSAENQGVNSHSYSVGAHGGLTWFVSKRFAFETKLLSANMMYSTTEQQQTTGSSNVYKSTQTSFDLRTEGFINDLGFKIYLLF